MRYAYNTSASSRNSKVFFCEKKHIRRQTNALASEKLDFLEGANLGDLDIAVASGETRHKIRRIIEKRICQDLYRRNKAASHNDNYGRYNEKHRVSNSLRNIYGNVVIFSGYAEA